MKAFPLLLVSLLAAAPALGEPDADAPMRGLPAHQIADPTAPVVTETNLLQSDRFWPYHVRLTRAWQPEGHDASLGAGSRGVLIRVHEGGARIDFGRRGLHDPVPVAATDLVAMANQVRLGELEKMGPNFVLAVASRLFDSESAVPQMLSMAESRNREGFLCVFADPAAEDFAALAASLAPLRERDGVLTVLFAQGEHPDPRLREQLRKLEWPVPIVFDRMSELYTKTLLGEDTPLPALQLVTNEGRLLFESPWKPEVVSALGAALEQNFGESEIAGTPSAP